MRAKLLVFDRELIDDAHEGWNVGTELAEFAGLVVAGCLEFGDGLAESGFKLGGAATLSNMLVEVVLQVGVSLRECVAGHLGFVCERHDGERPRLNAAGCRSGFGSWRRGSGRVHRVQRSWRVLGVGAAVVGRSDSGVVVGVGVAPQSGRVGVQAVGVDWTSSAKSRVCVARFPASVATPDSDCDSSDIADVIAPPSGICWLPMTPDGPLSSPAIPLIVEAKLCHAAADARSRPGLPSGHESGMKFSSTDHKNGGITPPPNEDGDDGVSNCPGFSGAVNGAAPPPMVDAASACE